jgi:hypothetical protein
VENRLDTAALFHTSSSLVTTNREDCERLRQLLANPDKQPSSVAREGLRARGIDCRAGSFQPMDSI